MKAALDVTLRNVANKIANDEPPLWLLLGLNHFSKYIIPEYKENSEYRKIDERMLEAAEYLSTWLPTLALEEFGFKDFDTPDCVEAICQALPELIELLEKDISEAPSGGGRRANVQQKICASVVVEAWRLTHGKVQHRSRALGEACRDYWLACGHEQTDAVDDPENWRRVVDRVLDGGEGVREVFERYRMNNK